MTIVAEGLAALRGCWRFICRDPDAEQDFNLTIDGFWRSFAIVVPLVVLMYPIFISDHRFGIELAGPAEEIPALNIGRGYVHLIIAIAVWPLAAALLAKLFGVAHNYVRYIVIYNWMMLPTVVLTLVPHVLHLAQGTTYPAFILLQIVVFPLLYVSWYVARKGLDTTWLIATVFVVADLALTIGMSHWIR